MAYVEGEMPISTAPAYGYGNGGFFGSDGIWAILLFAMIFGGWGNGFGGGGYGGFGAGNALLNATDNNQLHNEINTLEINNKLDSLGSNLNTGFGGLTNAITQNGYETRLALNDLSFRQQDCCCKTREAISGVGNDIASQIADLKYTLAAEECATRQKSTDNTQRIIDFLTQDKLATLTTQNAELKYQLDNNAQTTNIINALRPTPVPAFSAASLYGYYGSGIGSNSIM